MITVYRAAWSTNCERIALALAHKGLEAESVMIEYSDRSAVEEVSGQGLVPVIVDDGEVIADSVAIMRHLDRKYGEPLLFPPDDPAHARCEVFVEWFNEVYKHAPNAIEEELETGSPNLAVIEELERRIDGDMDVFDRMLAGGDYLLGEFSARRHRRLPARQVRRRPPRGRRRALPRDPRRAPERRGPAAPGGLDRAHVGAAGGVCA